MKYIQMGPLALYPFPPLFPRTHCSREDHSYGVALHSAGPFIENNISERKVWSCRVLRVTKRLLLNQNSPIASRENFLETGKQEQERTNSIPKRKLAVQKTHRTGNFQLEKQIRT